jgi:hypothetical protein
MFEIAIETALLVVVAAVGGVHLTKLLRSLAESFWKGLLLGKPLGCDICMASWATWAVSALLWYLVPVWNWMIPISAPFFAYKILNTEVIKVDPLVFDNDEKDNS